PDSPPGLHVHAPRCPVDSAHDGVPDGLDQCPDTPAGATVDAKGCPSDADNDGVPDGIDRCPNTPIGAKVDSSGCPIDSDHDGVPDGIDQCSDTPAGSAVDSTGCPIGKDSDGDGAPARPTLSLLGVPFATAQSALKPQSYVVLDQVAASLVANPEIQIEIAGYTDNTGSPTLNRRLSQARADRVRAYLASKGVSPS